MSLFAVMNALMTKGLTPNESRVYAYLVGRGNGVRMCWAEVPDIAADLDMTPRTVMACTKALAAKDKQLITVTRRYKDSNNYAVVDRDGLYDRPTYANAKRAAQASGIDWGADPEQTESADLKKTADMAPDPDLKKTADVSLSPEKDDILTCKSTHSDLKKTAQESIDQDSTKEDTKHTQRARATASPFAVADPPGWEAFKAAYPPHDGSWHVARLAYCQALAEGVDPEVIVAAAKAFPFRRDAGTRFVIHPATWLRERRWETEIPEPEPEESLADLIAASQAERAAQQKVA
jgi:hypothetical protein